MSGSLPGYRAALEGTAVRLLDGRRFLRVAGRAPVQMLQGILTSAIPAPEIPVETGVRSGRAFYSTLLTPKGRMVSDLRVLRTDVAADGRTSAGGPEGGGAGEAPATAPMMTRGPATAPGPAAGGESLLLDLPEAGLEGTLEHFGRFLPPRFATVEDVSDGTAACRVVGPGAASLLSVHALGLRVEEETLVALEEGGYRAVDTGGGSFVRVVAAGDVAAPAFDVVADPGTVAGLVAALEEAGAVRLGDAAHDALRIEAGRPTFGVDMGTETIPVEAGIAERAIDHGKGCYTGQEVIVRIRDRGRVNRRLRGLRLDPALPLPDPGTELFAPEERGERGAGRVTSSSESPRAGPIALAYVRREVAPGGTVRVGGVDGPEARVVDLEGGEWRPDRG